MKNKCKASIEGLDLECKAMGIKKKNLRGGSIDKKCNWENKR